jgi:serine/threonine-protein kinase
MGTVDPGTGFVYLPVPQTGKVWILKGTTLVSKVKVGANPESVSVDRATHEAYVANDDVPGTVSVIKGDSTKLVTTIRVGSDPGSSAVVSRTGLVYVANGLDGTVSVIKHNEVVATDTVSVDDSQLVADPANGIVLATGATKDQAVWALHGTGTLGSTPVAEPSLFAAFDSSNGRAFITGNGGDLFELQTPTAATVTVTRPLPGHHYVHGTHATATYTCTTGTNNTVTECTGSVPSGSRIPHRAGRHTFVVRARSAYGPAVIKTVHYRVAG